MVNEILRYCGVGHEATFGTPVAAVLHTDITGASLDPPSNPNIVYNGGMGRWPRNPIPGPYICGGSVDFGADISTLYYYLALVLGSITTSGAGVSTVSNETMGTPTGGVINHTAASGPIIPGSVTIRNTTDTTDVATDNGNGKIVPIGVNTENGWIDYITKEIHVEDCSDDLDTFDVTYDHGQYNHIIAPSSNPLLTSGTYRIGKDAFEHVFQGACVNSFTLNVEREFAAVTLDLLAQKDTKTTLTAEADLLLTPEHPIPFSEVCFWMADKGSALANLSAEINSLSLTISNNADADSGMGLCSRFTNRIYAAEFGFELAMTLNFDDASYLEKFWGDSAGPSNDYVLQGAEIRMTGMGGAAAYGDAVIALPSMVIQQCNIQPSGRDILMQDLVLTGLYDPITEEIMTAEFNNLADYTW